MFLEQGTECHSFEGPVAIVWKERAAQALSGPLGAHDISSYFLAKIRIALFDLYSQVYVGAAWRRRPDCMLSSHEILAEDIPSIREERLKGL